MKAKASLDLKAYASVSSRSYMSISHALTLGVQIRRARAVENGILHDHHVLPATEEHAAYVRSAIVIAMCFLEATINELFVDAADGTPRQGTATQIWQALATAATDPIVRGPKTLAKYEHALATLGNPSLKGTHLHRDVDYVRRLRNRLVHPKPETVVMHTSIPGQQKTVQSLESALKGRFGLNPLMKQLGANGVFFPTMITSADCAVWARDSVLAYMDEFHTRMLLAPPYDHVRKQLLAES